MRHRRAIYMLMGDAKATCDALRNKLAETDGSFEAAGDFVTKKPRLDMI